ncbi:hypothetical protein MMC21_002549 [Puttea exsequens]|nr:hypothetical protein [Puttea exsequens]
MGKGPCTKSFDELAQVAPPFFFCANNDASDAAAKEAAENCQDKKATYVNQETKIDLSLHHWLLCPDLINDQICPDPPTQETCPPLDEAGTEYVLNEDSLLQVTNNRMTVIVEVLAQTYPRNVGAANTTGMRELTRSEPILQAANPNNDAYLAPSRSPKVID